MPGQTKFEQISSGQLFQGRYNVLQILGRGGFGVTFLARDMILPGNPLCVIKQLCPKATNPKSWERACSRFEKEAKTLAQLGNHSQIPMLLDYFEVKGDFYLVQEYVKGLTLAQEIRRTGTKSEGEVKQFLRELLSVLQYVHQNRVIHRDIKPQNLLRCQDDGRLVLIDFGAVKDELVKASQTPTEKTASTNFVGTMGFAPPEQFCLRPVYASDIYAIAVTCLYLLTKKAPLEFDSDPNTGEICWRKEVEISENFASILSKMLHISLEERFKSVEDVLWALKMESYLPSLTNCLTTQKLNNNSKKISVQEYESPVARNANAIREWRKKLNSRK
ncbi:serine/threonine-protein kinase [Iningainema tapete]|nr:serine/threonine-protein kinase [Iningainema tapete]